MHRALLLALTWTLACCAPAWGAAQRADLCAGLVADKDPRRMQSLPQPARGAAVTDPAFGTRVVRITDVSHDFGATVAKPLYSTVPAWNADESRLILYVTRPSRGHALFDGATYELIRMLDIAPADLEQAYWDPVDPDVLWYVHNRESGGRSLRQLIRYSISTRRKAVVYEFPNAARPRAFAIDSGNDPQYPSWDMKLWGMRLQMPHSRSEKFAFFLAEKAEGAHVETERGTPQACPSGRCMWVPTVGASRLLDPRTYATVRNLRLKGTEHGDLGMNAAGEDFFAAVQFDGTPASTLIVENLQTGELKPLISTANGYPYPPTGTHISAIAFDNPGWIAVSVVGNPRRQQLLDQEILLANVDTGAVCRVAHHRSAGHDGPRGYWAEPHVTISRSGTRLLFASDWGGGETVDTYVVELPAFLRGPHAKSSPRR